jgi:hypothetical protein
MQTARLLFIAALSFTFHAGVASSADETKIDLQGVPPKVGRTTHGRANFEYKDAQLTLRFGDNTLTGTLSVSSVSEEEVEILAVDRNKVSKFRTKHIKDESKITTAINGNTQSQDETDDLAGTVVISEKRNGKWSHRLEKGEPTEKQQKALSAIGDWDDHDDIPAGQQSLGRSWNSDVNRLKKLIGGRVQSLSGNVKCKFARLEALGGEQCAVIESEAKLKAKNDDGSDVDGDLKIVEYRALPRGVVIKTKVDGTFGLTRTVKQGDADVKTEAKGRLVGEETAETKR